MPTSLEELLKKREHMRRRRRRKANRAMSRREKKAEVHDELQQLRAHAEHVEKEIEKEEKQNDPNEERLEKLGQELDETDIEIHELVQEKEKLDNAATKFARAARRARAAIKRLTKRIVKRRQQSQSGEVFDQGDWGARIRGGWTRNPSHTKRVMHHTAYPALSASASVAQECAKMRTIEAGHIARGFTGVGYHAVVFPSGRIYLGRGKGMIGAHTLGHNTGSDGVSMDGNYEVTQPTDAAIDAARKAFDVVGGGGPLFGHRQLGPTACPGRNLFPKLNQIN